MLTTLSRFPAIILLICVVGIPAISQADEVVVDRGETRFSIGGFRSSSCPDHDCPTGLGIIDHQNSGELCAGDLWKFFNSRGVQSLDRLNICVDFEKPAADSALSLRSVEFKIEDPQRQGELITKVSLENNTLIVPGDNFSTLRPEATLEILLGYDFMERFSADSKEKIKLDFAANDSDAQPSFSIGESAPMLSNTNLFLFAAFVVFWIGVFFLLNRLTKPIQQFAEGNADSSAPIANPQPMVTGSARSNRALSA